MCILCLREGGSDGGAVSARTAALQRRCRPRLADRPIELVASDGVVMADRRLCTYCERIGAAAAAADEATAAAAELSSAALAPDEPAGPPRPVRVRLPQLRVATLRQVLDFCRRHRNVAGDADAIRLMWRRLWDPLSMEDRARLGSAARYLGCAPLCALMGDGSESCDGDGAAAGAGSDRMPADAVMNKAPVAGDAQLILGGSSPRRAELLPPSHVAAPRWKRRRQTGEAM